VPGLIIVTVIKIFDSKINNSNVIRQMPPASGHALNEATPVVDAGDSAVPAVVGRTRTRTSGVVPGHQRDDQAQSDSDDSEMDRFYSLQLGRNTSRCAR